MKASPFETTQEMPYFIIEKVRAYREDTPPTRPDLVRLNSPEPILQAFRDLLEGTKILGAIYYNPYTDQMDSIPMDVNQLTSLHLQVLARNECVNVDGRMNLDLYNHLLNADQVARLRCLVKGTNVAGLVYATHTGGYRGEWIEFTHPARSIVIDQAGLQWQRDFRNSGGMHFYPTDADSRLLPSDYALWQQQMFLTMYGYERPLRPSDKTLDVIWNGLQGKLDLTLVSNALAVEFSQALDAAVNQGNLELEPHEIINFKFMRAGMGFFASGLTGDMHSLRVARLEGIKLALERIARMPQTERQAALGKIRRIALPHSDDAPYSDRVLVRIQSLVEGLGLVWGDTPEEDPFSLVDGYVNASTNCADPHAMIGNEGGHHSVDASSSCNANMNNHNAAYNNAIQPRIAPTFVFGMDRYFSASCHSHFSRGSIQPLSEHPAEIPSKFKQGY